MHVPNFRNKGLSAAPERGRCNYHFLIGRRLWLYPVVIAVSLSDLGGFESEQTRTSLEYTITPVPPLVGLHASGKCLYSKPL